MEINPLSQHQSWWNNRSSPSPEIQLCPSRLPCGFRAWHIQGIVLRAAAAPARVILCQGYSLLWQCCNLSLWPFHAHGKGVSQDCVTAQ